MSELSSELVSTLSALARDQEMSDIYYRGLQGINNLSSIEQMRFTLLVSSVFRIFNEQYLHYQEGSIDSPVFQSLKHPVEDLVGYTGVQGVWELRKHHFSEDYQNYVDKAIQLAPTNAKPLYPE